MVKPSQADAMLDALLDIDSVFDPQSAIMTTLRNALRSESIPDAVAWVALPTPTQGLLVQQVLGHITNGLVRLEVGVGRGLTGRVFERGSVHWVERYCDATSITHDFDEIMKSERVRRMIAAPLRAGTNVLGVLTVGGRDQGTFADELVTQVESLAHSAALALGIAQRSRAAAKASAVAERQRLSAEIHDGLSALLFSMASRSEALQRNSMERALANELETLQNEIFEAGTLVRSLVAQWHDSASGDLGAEVHQMAAEFEEGTGTNAFTVVVGSVPQLDGPRLRSLVRFVSVALANIERHAAASRAIVTVACVPTQISVVVSNDGPTATEVVPGVGLRSAAQSLERLGGSLSIVSDFDEGGFTIRARLPL
ncbi:MAG TPA: GAF domain-containing protein [Nocardioides sp.]|mgnify:CR=1 FL=1|nr:GAF domain-containing protein [Nocardioides sp.]